jgi:hypothetical protein
MECKMVIVTQVYHLMQLYNKGMHDNLLVVLQNATDLEKRLSGSCSETCPVSSQDADLVMSMKVEEVSGLQEEDVPMPTIWQAVKAEHEVSCMSLCPLANRFDRCAELPAVFLISMCVSVCPLVCPQETDPPW